MLNNSLLGPSLLRHANKVKQAQLRQIADDKDREIKQLTQALAETKEQLRITLSKLING